MLREYLASHGNRGKQHLPVQYIYCTFDCVNIVYNIGDYKHGYVF